LVYELAALHPPFQANSAVALARTLLLVCTLYSPVTELLAGKILRDPVLPLPKQYSVELQFLTERLLEKPPAKRPTAKQVGSRFGLGAVTTPHEMTPTGAAVPCHAAAG